MEFMDYFLISCFTIAYLGVIFSIFKDVFSLFFVNEDDYDEDDYEDWYN